MTNAATLSIESAEFYDHASNFYHAGQAAATARARREVIAEGKAYTVIAQREGEKAFWWNGCRYDVLGLAKDLGRNFHAVRMIDPNGHDVDFAAARY